MKYVAYKVFYCENAPSKKSINRVSYMGSIGKGPKPFLLARRGKWNLLFKVGSSWAQTACQNSLPRHRIPNRKYWKGSYLTSCNCFQLDWFFRVEPHTSGCSKQKGQHCFKPAWWPVQGWQRNPRRVWWDPRTSGRRVGMGHLLRLLLGWVHQHTWNVERVLATMLAFLLVRKLHWRWHCIHFWGPHQTIVRSKKNLIS